MRRHDPRIRTHTHTQRERDKLSVTFDKATAVVFGVCEGAAGSMKKYRIQVWARARWGWPSGGLSLWGYSGLLAANAFQGRFQRT